MNNFKDFCLGSAQFGMDYGLESNKKVLESEVEELINLFEENHGEEIDTAKAYGVSEKIISRYSRKSRITTKVSFENEPSIIKNDIEDSLELFGDSLETVLAHNPNYLKEQPLALQTFQDIKKQYNIKKIGISIYSFDDLMSPFFEINEIAECIDKIQISCNAFNRKEVECNTYFELIRQGVEIDFRSIFLQGALLNKSMSELIGNGRFQNYFKEWFEYCKFNELKPIEASILNLPKTSGKIVFGCKSVKELKELQSIKVKNKTLFNLQVVPPKQLSDPRLWNLK